MITVSDLNGKEAHYTWWLNIMPDEMPRLSILPKEIRDRLDYSPASLDVIEKYIVDNYTADEIIDRRNKFARDLFVRYIGETFRKNHPELFWSFESSDERNSHYGIPVLISLDEKCVPLSPTAWLTMLIQRGEGNFLRSQVRSPKAA
ncbi:MAG TPA: hypothetical protein VNU70_03375 [Puia sp.]|jgi:hypothetical protein|nr:hypothetical protein [Puia sp.]